MKIFNAAKNARTVVHDKCMTFNALTIKCKAWNETV